MAPGQTQHHLAPIQAVFQGKKLCPGARRWRCTARHGEMLPGKPLARKTMPAACGTARPLPQHRAVLLESRGTGRGTGASRGWHGACCHRSTVRSGAGTGRIRVPSQGTVLCPEGTARGQQARAEQRGAGGACRDRGERPQEREREGGGGGGEEGGVINRKLSIPQHLRDRGIAVIRPRGRKLAGLRERKPRLEEAAEESEVEDCYCIQASAGRRGGGGGGGGERGRERSTHGEGRGAGGQ